jgi:protein-tyrosine-phosphatase
VSETVPKQRVLFLCTHNSARSQMAEGLLRALGGDCFEAFSAGTEATHVRPLAIRAMAELGIDISCKESKTLDRYLDQSFDAVITVCDQANEACPVFFGTSIGVFLIRVKPRATMRSSSRSTARCARPFATESNGSCCEVS